MMHRLLPLFLCFILISGCVGQPPLAAAPLLSAAGVQREMAPQVTGEQRLQQVAGNNAFAFDLYRALRARPGNLFYSPYSLSVALAMAYAGARGETEQQMARVMHYALPQDQLHPTLNLLDQQLNSTGAGAFQLSLVDALWGQNGFPFRADYLALLAKNYGAGMRLADFTSDGSRETARKQINAWVKGQTQGKIQDLLAQGILDELTRLVLVNAIYFKGEWQDPFINGTSDAPFTLLDGKQAAVSLMARRAIAPYFQGDGFQAVALPYKDSSAEMIVVVPDASRFAQVEQAFDRSSLNAVLAGLKDTDLKLYLPRFHFDYSLDLKDPLSQMGMPDAFDPQAADFSGIYDRSQEPQNMYLAHVVHKAYVAVDEKGTEAAAASGLVAEIVSMPVELRVNRPFLFFILEKDTGLILFMGRVVEPNKESPSK